MKKALVHEWFVEYAGSERCCESFLNIWDDLDLYSIVAYPDEEIEKNVLKGKKVHTSFVQRVPFSRKKFRNYLALFPLAVEQFDLTGYDLILSSSHAVAKGALTNQNQLHICYCHTPIRYAWDLYHSYLTNAGLNKGMKGAAAKLILHYIRQWDIASSNRPDYFIANSKYIAGRIKKTYNRDSVVIHPPVNTHLFPLETNKEEYYLTASRLVPYKKIDLIVDAFAQMPDKKLLVIGDGTARKLIESKAAKNIELLGYQPADKLNNYMRKAKAFVFAAEEDFGITVVEAQSCGTPVIALNKGGTAETVIDKFNGVHFNEQTAASIIEGVKKFESVQSFDYTKIHESAQKYSKNNFEDKIKIFVNEKCNIFFNNNRTSC